MKKILVVFAVMFSIGLFAQSPVLNSSAKEAKSSGVYEFTLPSNITKTDVNKAAAYYTKYFKTSQDGQKVKLTMTENVSNNRHVMKRFFITLGFKNIEMNGESLKIDTFFKEHVQ